MDIQRFTKPEILEAEDPFFEEAYQYSLTVQAANERVQAAAVAAAAAAALALRGKGGKGKGKGYVRQQAPTSVVVTDSQLTSRAPPPSAWAPIPKVISEPIQTSAAPQAPPSTGK